MPSLREALDPFAAVILTGGSSGIGKTFLELGVELKPDLVLCNVSRRAPAEAGAGKPRMDLHHFPCDLARATEIDRVAAELSVFLGRIVPAGRILLINNSGFGTFGRFPGTNVTRELGMIDVNVRAVVHLTGLLLPLLKARGGAIMNIASTMAFQPTAYAATYGATKAFVLHWTLALNEELRGTRVRALAVCPGTTSTEFFRAAGMSEGATMAAFTMTPEDVVTSALRALGSGRAQVVPGWKNKLYTFASSKLPKSVAARIGAAVLARYRLGRAGKGRT